MTVAQMYDAADSILAQKLAQVEGVGQVFVWGSSQPAVRAEVNPTLLNKLGVGLDTVRNALNAANANRPKGKISTGTTSYTLDDTDQLFTADEYRPLIVAYHNGAAGATGGRGRGDMTRVSDRRNLGLINGKPGVMLAVFRQPGANIIDTVDRVRALIPYLQSSISPSMTLSSGDGPDDYGPGVGQGHREDAADFGGAGDSGGVRIFAHGAGDDHS